MKKRQPTLILSAILHIILLGSFIRVQTIPDTIILKDEKLNIKPLEFYIAGVTDERTNREAVAALIINSGPHLIKTKFVDIQGGVDLGFKRFIDYNLVQNKALRPVIIRINAFKLNESALPNGRIAGQLSLNIGFDLQLNDTTTNLVNYQGGLHYIRSAKIQDYAESALRNGMEDALSYFDNWMRREVEGNPKLAKDVKVFFSDYYDNDTDTIQYSINRPLCWDDFQGKPQEGRFAAEVFASIGYEEHIKVESGIIKLNIIMKTYVPKNDCWVKTESRNDYTLNHEQRHFDIEKLVSERFKKKITAMRLPVANYDGPINVEYLETLREATKLQKLYDAETRHGIDQQQQESWNVKIDKELKDSGLDK